MRTLEELRSSSRRNDSLLTKVVTPVTLAPEQYSEGRKEYEEFVKPTSQVVFARQLMKGNI
jgi:hypothetical protein